MSFSVELELKAADRFFTNTVGGDYTNKTLWMTGIVPVNSDNAFFTNNTSRQVDWTMNITNAGTFFNTTVDTTYTQAMASSTWYVTNMYAIATNSTFTTRATQISGTLVVTNAGGTASMVVGGSGVGTFNLNGGSVIVDHLYVTNVNSSLVRLNSGTLTIQGDSMFGTNSTGLGESLIIGTNASSATLNLLGGTTFMHTNLVLGSTASSTGIVNISGSSTILSNRGQLYIGDNGSGSRLTISNGARVFLNREAFLGNDPLAFSNIMVMSGSGSTFSNGQEFVSAGSYNQLYVTNGADFTTLQLIFGSNSGGSNSLLFVSSGAHFQAGSSSHLGNNGTSNMAIITDSGTLLEFKTSFSLGNNLHGMNNHFVVTNGATVSGATVRVGINGDGNKISVTGINSKWTNTSDIFIGEFASSNTILVNQGGSMYGDRVVLSSNSDTINNMLVVSNAGSIFRATSAIVGSNDLGFGTSALILISDRGTLEANSITNGLFGTGNITNSGGIFQFTTAAPSIFTNAGGTIFMTNGVISYRNVANAPVLITNNLSRVSMFGSNTLMLMNSTNAILSNYIFTNGFTGTNYAHLALINGSTRWQATNTTFGASSTLLVSNTTATVFGTVTNSGKITIAGSSTIFEGAFGGSGSISIDGSSQITFSNSAAGTVTISGVISGAGSLQHLGNDTLVLSANNTFTGAVTNGAGILQINSPTGLGFTTSIAINGGTLLFNSSLTNTSASVVLNGGTIQEVDTNVSLGALTIAANSSVVLGSAGGIGRLTFASGTNAVGSGAKLTIYGWSWNSAMTGGSDDLIFFTNTSFETTSFLSNVNFFGTGGGARVLSSGELVPIAPEPSTTWGGVMLLALGYKRLKKRLFKTRPPS